MSRRVDSRARGRVVLVGALLLAACRADRVLIVTSDPAGAEVLLDGSELGVTPLEHPFVHYGTRRLTFHLEDYLTTSEVIEVRPPWYARFPLDMVTEVLLPIGWRDEHAYHADLVRGRGKIEAPDLRSVLQRAETLRTAGPEGPRGADQERAPAPPVEEAATKRPTAEDEPAPPQGESRKPSSPEGADPEGVPPARLEPGPPAAPAPPGGRRG